MANLFLAVFLLLFGLNLLLGLALPPWLIGLLAVVSGLLLLAERFNLRIERK